MATAAFFLISLAIVPFWTILAWRSSTSQSPLRVGAFNIRAFGVSKMSNKKIASRIVNILQRYDLVLIQEVRDLGGSVLHDLEVLLDASSSWSYVASKPIGRTRYKEQYAFFYRTQSVRVTGQYQYDDSDNDIYEREPFAIEIMYTPVNKLSPKRVVFIGLHTRPEDTPEELEHLPGVMKILSSYFSLASGVIAMGDFNADCDYLSKKMRASMEIFRTNSTFKSYINDTVDTTVNSGTNCAYDRVISLGKVVITRAQVYNFASDLGISETDAKAISDHYPVEFTLN